MEDKVSDPKAISTISTMQRATAAAYYSYAWHSYDIVFSILAEEFQPSTWLSHQPSDRLRYQWDERSLRDEAINLWTDHYRTIMLCNTVLERVKDVTASTGAERLQRNALQGSVMLLKARCYLQLLQIFAAAPTGGDFSGEGIILRDKVVFELRPRSSVEKSLRAIETLISEALELLKNNPVTTEGQGSSINWLDYHAGLLLQAQTALWKNDFNGALNAANELLNLKGTLIEGNAKARYEAMWTAKGAGDAIYAHDQTDKQRGVRLYINAIQYDSDNGDLFNIAAGTELAASDVRKQFYEIPFFMPNGEQATLWGKYNYLNRNRIDFFQTYDLRATEALFIKVECLAQLGRELEAHTELNRWLKTLKSPSLDASLTGDPLIRQILRLKMQEFRGEGTSYFDIKRMHWPIARFQSNGTPEGSKIEASDFRWVWPIPRTEIHANSDLQQNPGWESER